MIQRDQVRVLNELSFFNQILIIFPDKNQQTKKNLVTINQQCYNIDAKITVQFYNTTITLQYYNATILVYNVVWF